MKSLWLCLKIEVPFHHWVFSQWVLGSPKPLWLTQWDGSGMIWVDDPHPEALGFQASIPIYTNTLTPARINMNFIPTDEKNHGLSTIGLSKSVTSQLPGKAFYLTGMFFQKKRWQKGKSRHMDLLWIILDQYLKPNDPQTWAADRTFNHLWLTTQSLMNSFHCLVIPVWAGIPTFMVQLVCRIFDALFMWKQPTQLQTAWKSHKVQALVALVCISLH